MDEQSRAKSEANASRGDRGRQAVTFVLAIALLAVGGLYAALAMLVRVDSIFFPGNTLELPGPLGRIPGLDAGVPVDSALTERINILILGLDRRPHHPPGADGPPRSDSMYVLSVDPISKSGGLLAIPRDLYVQMPNPTGRGGPWVTRINTAYHYGAYYKYPGGGAALARETVEQTFKIKINYYVVVDWVAFADIIDALGGVEVTVPTPLSRVEAFNVRDGNAFFIDIRAGRQLMEQYHRSGLFALPGRPRRRPRPHQTPTAGDAGGHGARPQPGVAEQRPRLVVALSRRHRDRHHRRAVAGAGRACAPDRP